MSIILSPLLIAIAVVVAIPTVTLCIEIFAAFLRFSTRAPLVRGPGRIAVIVPARNESAGIASTLAGITAQLRPNDILLVVADNCTDNTAEVARNAGATVVERHDAARIGKGYALDFGVKFLQQDPPSAVLIVDADCRLSLGAIDELVATAVTANRPVQALYLMTAPEPVRINQQISEFAWRVKNWVRPLGLFKLALPCQLMGTGMAFPWQIIRAADLANGSIVEDLKLGLDLAAAGQAPIFCSSARVLSQFASTKQGEDTQRQRWEQGHISTILRQTPRLFLRSLLSGNVNLLALTLDLAVPPLSLLAMLVLLDVAIAAAGALLGLSIVALAISAITLVAFGVSVAMAWRSYGRDVLPPSALAGVPLYALRKFGLYRQAVSGKHPTKWVGTDRSKT